MAKASDALSLDDFGAESFREGLERLIESADSEARFTEMGRAAFDAQIVDFLCCRLQVEDWYARHPEIDHQQITAPLIGLGLPRTGSTALSILLAADPAVRFIRNWEALKPCPPPETASEHTDPRIELSKHMLARRDRLFPRMKAMVPSTPTGPMECQTFMGFDFKSQLFQATARLPSYVAWLNHEADLEPTYRYVKRVLKLLQWRCPPTRWRLKNPSHIVFIDALDKVFPDARYWMTHRDIASVLPSVADLYFELNKAFSDDVDKSFLARQNADWMELGMRRVIAFRDRGNDRRFFDIHFLPFQNNPFPIMEKLYEFLGEEFSPDVRSRMQTCRESLAQERLAGGYRHDAAEFGIDLYALRERFRFYSDRFNVAISQ